MTHESDAPEGKAGREGQEDAQSAKRVARSGGRESRESRHSHEHGRGRGRERNNGRGGPRHPGKGRRGDIRAALLIALQDAPAHGYELMQLLAEKSEGRWRPSPGSVYPSLQMLEDEGLLSSIELGGKRIFTLTEAGACEAQARTQDAGDVMPWERARDQDESTSLREAIGLLELAARQASLTRDEALVVRVTEVVTAARKSIYQLLAE